MALAAHSSLVAKVREKIAEDLTSHSRGDEYREYAAAVAVYLGFAVSKAADLSSALCFWQPNAEHLKIAPTFSRHALTYHVDFAEGNPFSSSSGNYFRQVELLCAALPYLGVGPAGIARQEDARSVGGLPARVVSTDPPYYDNVPYADLSDFFYIWLRQSLQPVVPEVFRTLLVPKAPELVADPFRHGGKEQADSFFMAGMTAAMRTVCEGQEKQFPAAVYYAFKQSEADSGSSSSTGWETFLAAILEAGFSVVGTWPVRTARPGRFRETGSNALATAVVLVCRARAEDAPSITRSDFRRLLRQELPKALKALQKGNIAPVDMAQASIGPGMAIFSRHSKVMEADGSPMTVRTALQLINEALDEYLAEQTGEFDTDTRFAVTWFETRGFEPGPYGEAETLAKARNVSVQGVVEAGIIKATAGKVRLLKRAELDDDWEPETDDRLTVWECTQNLIKRLEDKGETVAANLLSRLGANADPARDLAYRLYQTCERKGWAEEARAYNGLVVAWPELARLAAQVTPGGPAQQDLFR